MTIATLNTKSKIVNFISLVSGKEFEQKDITPYVKFLAALLTVLVGVISADQEIKEDETKRLMENLYRFSKPDSNLRRLTHAMYFKVRTNKIYQQFDRLSVLADCLSESEKLLLIAFGYDVSAADGDMDVSEKQYLEKIANLLAIDLRYLAVLEAGFSGKDNIDMFALDEVRYLLDPARFRDLDVAFVKATNDILAVLPNYFKQHKVKEQVTALPTCQKQQEKKEQVATSYQELQKFQQACKQLDNYCYQLYEIVKECNEHNFLPDTLIKEIGEISHKLQSQSFRIAVVGEFSQGKSTLLNALLGEEIQPVRAIPCSGTITVLKYGTKKRVICRYKDGREEEIPFEQYQEKAAISREAALDGVSDELATSEIKEIIFEHPDLELCRHGVEIVDSPGLNEHPERTFITQQLIKDTDAVIFLIDARKNVTQVGKKIIQDLRQQLNGGKANIPAENLFIITNFIDLCENETDREDIRQRVTRFVQGNNPIIIGENRIHFISAKCAFNAIKDGYENEYLNTFNFFAQSIENFLINERGSLKIKQAVNQINNFSQESYNNLNQAEKILDGKINISEENKQKIIEQIGEASGRSVKIDILVDKILDQVSDETDNSWDIWLEGLDERLLEKTKQWNSEHSIIWSRDKLIHDYINQFNQDLVYELNYWIENELKNKIVKKYRKILTTEIINSLKSIKQDIKDITETVNTNNSQYSFLANQDFETLNDQFDIFGDIGMTGLGLTLLAGLFTGGIFLSIVGIVGSVITGYKGGSLIGKDEEIRSKIHEYGTEKFAESVNKIFEDINNIIISAFAKPVHKADEIIEYAITYYENLLEQADKTHSTNIQGINKNKKLLSKKCEELEQIQNDMNKVLAQVME